MNSRIREASKSTPETVGARSARSSIQASVQSGRRLLALVLAGALLGSGILSTKTLAVAQSSRGSDTLSVSQHLDPSAPSVIATRIVALPKRETKAAEVRSQVMDAAAGLAVSAQTELSINPQAHDRESLVIVTSDEENSEALLEEMRASGLYEAVDFDVLAQPLYSATPNDPFFASNTDNGTWNLRGWPGSQFSSVWPLLSEQRGSASSAPIAVLDTSFDLDHEDRGTAIVPGYDFGSNDSDVNPDPGDRDADVFHGTSTAGLIAAATDNDRGIAGAGWDNRVVFYKVADQGDDIYLSAVSGAINDVVSKNNAKIISMSLGGDELPDYLRYSIDMAVSAGILVVASAGNSAQDEGNPVLYPAAYGPVLSVGALDPGGSPSAFSTYNSAVDIAAPGENITVLGLNNEYLIAAGTSYSCPMVASAAAMVWRMMPGLAASQVQTILCDTAVDVTAAPASTGKDIYTGAGALDALGAVEFARGLPIEPEITGAVPGKTCVTLSWLPSSEDTRPLTGYSIQYRLVGGSSWRTVAVSAAVKSYTIAGLSEGSSYEFRVAAKNSAGTGAWSVVRTAAPYPPPVFKAARKTIYVQKGKRLSVRLATYYSINNRASIDWKSSKRSVATVTTSGKKAAKAGKGYIKDTTISTSKANPGSAITLHGATVTVKGSKAGTAYLEFTCGRAKTYKVKVKVVAKKKRLKTIRISSIPRGKKLKVGAVDSLGVKISPQKATGVKVTWSSNHSSIISIDAAGKMTARKKGSATITLKAGGKTKKLKMRAY